jgi:hypothetical protein
MRTCTVGVFVVGALLSVGVACGDDDGGPSDTLDIEKPTLPGPTGPTIQVRNYAFDPALVTITVGETVTWAWGSALIGPHNVLPDDDVTPGQSGDPENGPRRTPSPSTRSVLSAITARPMAA